MPRNGVGFHSSTKHFKLKCKSCSPTLLILLQDLNLFLSGTENSYHFTNKKVKNIFTTLIHYFQTQHVNCINNKKLVIFFIGTSLELVNISKKCWAFWKFLKKGAEQSLLLLTLKLYTILLVSYSFLVFHA